MQPSDAVSANPLQRWVNWAPLWLGMGVSAYFLLPFEPPLAVGWGLLGLLPILWGVRHRLRMLAAMLAILGVYSGFACAAWQTSRVDGPVLKQALNVAAISGRVRDIVIDGKRQKMTLDQVVIEGIAAQDTPRRIRVSASGGQEVGIGQRIEARASLAAPSRPVMPGGFDFGRFFFFRQIGGIGYILPPLSLVPSPEPKNAVQRLQDWMTAQRLSLTRYLNAVLPSPANALAVAYVTGDQSAVSEELQQNMRAAGLSHILAISGMHMTIVCGIVYFMVRLVLAAIPWAALRFDIRKPAALLAIISGGLYLWLADFPVSAVRAYVMIAIFFTAILCGREGDGLRSLALAAIVILLVQPSSLMEPGFQLSFAAVLALILYYRWWTQRRDKEGWEKAGTWRRVTEYFIGIMLTSLVAGLATAPIAAYHFHQFSSYGLLANTVCIPLISFIVTPALMLGMALSPLGLSAPMMNVVEWGFDAMVWIAVRSAELPGALLNVPPLHAYGVVFMLAGGGIMLLHGRKVKLAGASCVMLGLSGAFFYMPPNILISANAKAIAIRNDNRWELLKGTARNFAVQEWQMALGEEMSIAMFDRCDHAGCVKLAEKRRIALPEYERALAEDCLMADLVVTSMQPSRIPCAARLIDGNALQRYGTHALWFTPRGMRVMHGCSDVGKRPWNRC